MKLSYGEGLQVVRVERDHTYKLDERKLRSLLLAEDIKELPVVLVSIAGPYRGGKSFMLSLFIKYLMSNEEDQCSGQWLETGDAPLGGFSWRGGSQRNTTGILFWSKPFIRTLSTGEQVAVILMDTQGTFDNKSTVKDNTTIFALSTLISSVQIFNVSSRIQEDHLQELELFTDYGKLIKGENEKPFQNLEFLIRDWPHSETDYAYGADGGQQYINAQLDVNCSGLSPAMIRLREHIYASFENVTCFLTPHPGFAIENKNFKGQSNELREVFRDSVKELVSSLFSEAKMKVKRINGERVKAKELFEYIKSYMAMCSSNEVPDPTSIVEAISKAEFLLAVTVAREQYEANMDKICGSNTPSVTEEDVREQHRREMEAAKVKFGEKKKLGSKEDEEKHLHDLIQMLENRKQEYIQINFGKTIKAMSDAKDAYHAKVNEITKGKPILLHAKDLERVHVDAMTAGLDKFRENRRVLYQTEDPDEIKLEKELNRLYSVFRNTNEQNNSVAILELKQQYWEDMMRLMSSAAALTTKELTDEHEKKLQKSLDEFDSKRNFVSQYTEDVYKYKLETVLKAAFNQLLLINRSNLKQAYKKTIKEFEKNLYTASEIRKHCFHPQEWDKVYKEAVCAALKVFSPDRSSKEGFHDNDEDEENVLKICKDIFDSLTEINDFANKAAINEGFEAFRGKFAELTGWSWWYLLVIPVFMSLANREYYYGEAKKFGIEKFYYCRRNPNYREKYDKYYIELEEKIAEHHE